MFHPSVSRTDTTQLLERTSAASWRVLRSIDIWYVYILPTYLRTYLPYLSTLPTHVPTHVPTFVPTYLPTSDLPPNISLRKNNATGMNGNDNKKDNKSYAIVTSAKPMFDDGSLSLLLLTDGYQILGMDDLKAIVKYACGKPRVEDGGLGLGLYVFVSVSLCHFARLSMFICKI